ncbi:uncharacterized protein LOC131182265 [Hevea brasiliensis]|uniref:uncharacterized protein LOC131182265 n=1 Tax=Hevea brasiliensis TaxID=3981 RepID=UPI0025DE95BF|nr:uncharacterized protein LOC131182265 [Hevea brasiliensis]
MRMAEADSNSIQFFVEKKMDGHLCRWILANSNDTTKSVHCQIREVFGILLTLQKLYYFGKRLEWHQTLKECSIKNNGHLQLVLRKDGVTRQNSFVALNLVSQIHAMCQRKSVAFDHGCISNKIRDLFSILRQQTVFLLDTLPWSFVTLYKNNEEIGDAVIRFFLDSLLKMVLAKGWLDKCASILLRLCDHFRWYDDDLFFKHIFSDLLSKMEAYLANFEDFLYMESVYCGYSQYLTILKALHGMSKFHKSAEERFLNVLRNKRRSLAKLIAEGTDRSNDHLWLLERKDVTDGKSRMHLAMMMMTEIRIHDVELHEMLVWSEKLDANLYMAFKNQQITNRGVQQSWLRQLCGAIFNPQKSHFLVCPNDPKRFYPNPAIEPKTLDLECFKFVGKLVAIALMSEIQIGVAFAHVFLMQLAGRRKISLEDVRDLDPSLHSWCKEIIDGEVIDSEVLEFPEALLGCQWSTELSYVNSKSSREAYVDRLIQHRFFASISEQVSFLIQGFDSVFGTSIGKLLSVKGLELEDLNESLCGYVITTTLQLDNKSNPLMSRFPKAWQFPKIHDAKLYEMLIVWSKNLSKNLYMQFKNQQVTDPGVLQHWLCKLCGAIFNPQKNPLFLACPNDPNRFYPNHAIELEPFHFDCLEFVGKLVALALMYEIQVGVTFAHLFLLQLAGKEEISLEDVIEVDPYLYRWCKKVIDAELIDSEVLEFAEAELGRQWSTELSHVNSKSSRESYVDRLIQHRFVKSISNQLLFFRKGFDNVFGTSIDQLFSFNGRGLKDFNESLCGCKISGTSQLNKRKFLNNDCNKSDTLMHRFQKVRRKGRNITNWRRGVRLGSGSFGSVYEGFAVDGFFFAVKELLLPDGGIIDQLEKEVDLLCQLTHPNVVKYFGTSKDESKLYVFLELVSKGSLEKVYKEFPLQDSHVSVYTKQILKGLNYLHERNVVHRDIKCANVLVDENGCVKIADFGLAKVTNSNAIIKSCKGTVYWMAPEVFNNKKAGGYGFQADIWSVGCTVLEMLTGKPPYSDLGLEKGQLIYRIGKGHLPSLPDSLSDDSRDFIQRCLKVNPKDRPTTAELLEHPFVNK